MWEALGKKEVEVEPLNLKKKPHDSEDQSATRKIRNEHGTPLLPLPKGLLQTLGLKMNERVVIIPKEGSNPLAWEITVKPAGQSKHTD